MPTYVAFLRAINLGAKRKFPKAEIIAATEAAGGRDVATHINTGNVRLSTTLRSTTRVRDVLEAAYADQAGFEVPTVVLGAAEVAALADDVAELTSPDLARHYVYLLRDQPTAEAAAALEACSDATNRAVVRGRAAHLLLGPGYEAGNVDPFKVERTLGVAATNRNATVVTTVAQKWC